MKPIKLGLVIAAAVLIAFGLSPTAMAFHDGGVAHCDGCHTMHNSEDGQSIIEGGVVGTAGQSLTLGTDPSSTCLNCHKGAGSYHIFSDDGSNWTPGGDFYWMTKEFVYETHGTHTSKADNHGHNVIAADFGLAQDKTLTTAPGGTFPSALLACSSCHDPHGKKVGKTLPIGGSGSYGDDPEPGTENGNYRILADIGYQPAAGTVFTVKPPVAVTPHYRRPSGQESDSNHTDYGSGMSEWCVTCHTGFYAGGKGEHRHPAANTATLGQGNISDNYNIYVATGDLTGTRATSYLALVPFERGVSDQSQLDQFSTEGPDGNSNVMCLSCHRAHASAFPNAGRWDFETEFLVDSHPQDTDDGAVPGDQLNSYYGRVIEVAFNAQQRSLCNKCHIQD